MKDVPALVASLRKRDGSSWQQMVTFVREKPESVLPLASALFEDSMLDTCLAFTMSYLTESEFAFLLQRAVVQFLAHPGDAATSESVIAQASLQFPHLLRPHLERFRTHVPNQDAYYGEFPWRAAGDEEITVLLSTVEDTTSPLPQRRSAANRLLQTRRFDVVARLVSFFSPLRITNREDLPEAFKQLVQLAEAEAHLLGPGQTASQRDLNTWLHSVGIHSENDALRSLYSEAAFHVQFPRAFFDCLVLPPWKAHDHPTWNLEADTAITAQVGGSLDEARGGCTGSLHRLIECTPFPQGYL